ncbi:MAG TPA: c-type cytochrome [Actinomycetota bacterium]|nr:c-type cytochrome [Actinomycetota bacterium]
MSDRQARLLTWVLRAGLIAAIVGQVAWSFRPSVGRAQTDEEALGRRLYQSGCITCHGVDGRGTELGPSLEDVGTASVDFYLSTGRMPLANPGDQADRRPPVYTDPQIAAIVAYLRPLVAGGPEIPEVDIAGADLSRGALIFLDNCAACHGAGAGGDSIGGGQIAPAVGGASPQQIVEAIRIGPGLMPRWGETTIEPADADAVAAYLVWLRDNADEGGLQLGRVGAVAEGLVAMVVGIGLILLVIRLTKAQP